MKKFTIISTLALLLVAGSFFAVAMEARAEDTPADRVVVMYFHRTQRCPTCKKMGSYSEEATKSFTEPIENKTLSFHYVNFQDTKNEALTKGFKITGPTLIVAKVKDNKFVSYENLKEMWKKVKDKDEFIGYVQENITAGLTEKE